MKLLYVFAAISFSFQISASTDVVYGEDNRVDVYASENSFFVELSKSTAAMVKASQLKFEDGLVEVMGMPLTDRGICSSERFAKQMTAADCSGFLVSETLLVTAGHCVTGQSMCDKYKWVFDYKVEADEQYSVSVPENNVYSCKSIISRTLDNWSKDDYALIELDRPVEDRRPLEYRKSGKPEYGDPLVVIGHPVGLPTKIADGASVRELNGSYFSANLDTYGGNSGSAVFNAQTGIVEGILVRGEKDFEYDYEGGCRVTYRVSDHGGRGEDVTYIGNIPELK